MRIVLANIQRTVILGAMKTEGFGEDLGCEYKINDISELPALINNIYSEEE